jgi:hypothetical protein
VGKDSRGKLWRVRGRHDLSAMSYELSAISYELLAFSFLSVRGEWRDGESCVGLWNAVAAGR